MGCPRARSRSRRFAGAVAASTVRWSPRPVGGHVLAHVSISRRSDLVIVAVEFGRTCRRRCRAARGWRFRGFDDVAVHTEERVSTASDRTRLWVRKESVLKATGDGLTVDPRRLQVTDRRLGPATGCVGRPRAWRAGVDVRLVAAETPMSGASACWGRCGPSGPSSRQVWQR